MSTECIYNQHADARFTVACTVAHEYTQTQLSNREHLDTSGFVKMPQIGEYILSHCRTQAYRVVRHQKAEACGTRLTVLFVADPTPVLEHNPAPDKIKSRGIPVHVHNRKCTSHCIDIYYLHMIRGHAINANLL
jgi:hypothetical protein